MDVYGDIWAGTFCCLNLQGISAYVFKDHTFHEVLKYVLISIWFWRICVWFAANIVRKKNLRMDVNYLEISYLTCVIFVNDTIAPGKKELNKLLEVCYPRNLNNESYQFRIITILGTHGSQAFIVTRDQWITLTAIGNNKKNAEGNLVPLFVHGHLGKTGKQFICTCVCKNCDSEMIVTK